METNKLNVGDSSIEITEKEIRISSEKIVFESALTPPNTKAT